MFSLQRGRGSGLCRAVPRRSLACGKRRAARDVSWDNIANTKLKFFRLLSESDRFLKNFDFARGGGGRKRGARSLHWKCRARLRRGFVLLAAWPRHWKCRAKLGRGIVLLAAWPRHWQCRAKLGRGIVLLANIYRMSLVCYV